MALFRVALLFALPAVLTGCAVSHLSYLSPSVAGASAEYLHMHVGPEEHGKKYPPTGIRVDVDGVRIAISSSRGSLHGGIARTGMPDPVCARETALVALLPVAREEWNTDAFEVQIAVSGADVSFDPPEVTLVVDGHRKYAPARVAPARPPGQAWVVRFATPCVPDSAYDLLVDGVTRDGIRVVVPAIHFAPVTTSSPFGP